MLNGEVRERVIVERDELEVKVTKLQEFLLGLDEHSELTQDEKKALSLQLHYMVKYIEVLIHRLKQPQ